MKPFSNIAIAVFALVALAQLIRVVLGWEVTVNGTVIPFWASLLAFGITVILAIMLWREKRK
jgi:hypothetical protein